MSITDDDIEAFFVEMDAEAAYWKRRASDVRALLGKPNLSPWQRVAIRRAADLLDYR